MTTRDEYLNEVGRAMTGMDARVRADILRELAAHIADATTANGGDLTAAIAALGSPVDLGRHYRELYGYGRRYQVLFAAIAFVLAVPSVPVLGGGPEGPYPLNLSLLFLIADAAWILWVSVAAGSRTGLAGGLAAFAARLAALAISATVQPGAIAAAGGLALFVTASAGLIVLGWIPGTARKAWSGPRAEL